jgi:phenylpyruvate tautomerase PptA (4-oxalocrotonate tautomerase family)
VNAGEQNGVDGAAASAQSEERLATGRLTGQTQRDCDHDLLREVFSMPMIDVYCRPGLFADTAALAKRLAATLMEVEAVPPISLFKKNTAAFIHEVTLANVDGDDDRVRVQVITNKGALDRDKQLAAVARLSDVVAEEAGDPGLAARTWVILTETYDGGWGIAGHANTNEEIIALARAELAG